MTDPAGIQGDRIRSFIERVEHIDEEIKALNEGKKDVLAGAKGEGFDVKVLKEILRLRKLDKDERDEHESLLDLYCELWKAPHRREKQRRRRAAQGFRVPCTPRCTGRERRPSALRAIGERKQLQATLGFDGLANKFQIRAHGLNGELVDDIVWLKSAATGQPNAKGCRTHS